MKHPLFVPLPCSRDDAGDMVVVDEEDLIRRFKGDHGIL